MTGDGVRCLKQIRIGVGYILTILSHVSVSQNET